MKQLKLILLFLFVPLVCFGKQGPEFLIGPELLSTNVNTKASESTNSASAQFNFLNLRGGVQYSFSNRFAVKGSVVTGFAMTTASRLSGYSIGGVWAPFKPISVDSTYKDGISLSSVASKSWFIGLNFQQIDLSVAYISLSFSGFRAESGVRLPISQKENITLAGFFENMTSGEERSLTGFGLAATYNITLNLW